MPFDPSTAQLFEPTPEKKKQGFDPTSATLVEDRTVGDAIKEAVGWNSGLAFTRPEGVTEDTFSAGVPEVQFQDRKRNVLMENSLMRGQDGLQVAAPEADSLPTVQRLNSALPFERKKEQNRTWLDNNRPFVEDQLSRNFNLAPEDAAVEFERMKAAGVVPDATRTGMREATWGEALQSGAGKIVPAFDKSMSGIGSAMADVTGDLSLAADAARLREDATARYEAADAMLGGTDADAWKRTVANVAPSLSQNLPPILMSAITKNPAFANLGLAGMGASTFGDSYASGKQQGLNTSNNLQQSVLKSIAEVGPEKLSLNALMKFFGKVGGEEIAKQGIYGVAKEFAKQQGIEHATEQITTLAQAAVDKAYTNPEMTLGDLVGQMAETFKATLIQAPLLAGAGSAAVLGRNAVEKAYDPLAYALRGFNEQVENTNFIPLEMPGGQGGFAATSRVGADGRIDWGATTPAPAPVTDTLAGMPIDRIPDAQLETARANAERRNDPALAKIEAELARRQQAQAAPITPPTADQGAAPINQDNLLAGAEQYGTAGQDQGQSAQPGAETGAPDAGGSLADSGAADRGAAGGTASPAAGGSVSGDGQAGPAGQPSGQSNVGVAPGTGLAQTAVPAQNVTFGGLSNEASQAAPQQTPASAAPGAGVSGLRDPVQQLALRFPGVSFGAVRPGAIPARAGEARSVTRARNREAELVEKLFGLAGTQVHFVTTADGVERFGGIFLPDMPGHVFIDVNNKGAMQKALRTRAAHEAFHDLEERDPELFHRIALALRKVGAAKLTASKFQPIYDPTGAAQVVDNALATSEQIANLFGNVLHNPAKVDELLQMISGGDVSLAAKVVAAIKRAINAIKANLASLGTNYDVAAYAGDLDQVSKILMQGYAEFARSQNVSPVSAELQVMREARQTPATTIAKENQNTITVGGKPGEFGWAPNARMAAALIDHETKPEKLPGANLPPFIAPVQYRPNLTLVGKAVRKVLSAKAAQDVIRDVSGANVTSVVQVMGSWEGKPEPSFILSGDMTFEQADLASKLLGFAFAQDATVAGQPWFAEAEDQIPAILISQNKPMSAKQLVKLQEVAAAAGLDYSTTMDGHGAKFLHFGGPEEYDGIRSKVDRIATSVGLTNVTDYYVRSNLNEAEAYLASGVGQVLRGSGDQDGAAGPSDLFRRTVDHLVVPYVKAVGAEGYRFSADRFGQKFGLSEAEVEYIRAAVRPKNGKQLSTVAIVSGKEKLDTPRTNTRTKIPGVSKFDLAWAIQNRTAAVGLIDASDRSPAASKILADALTDEVVYALNQEGGKSAVGWYDKALHEAKNNYEKVFPELRTDRNMEMLFDAVLGVASQGNDVHSNALFAGRVYHLMTREGMTLGQAVKVLTGTFGKQTRAIELNLLKLEALIDRNGYDAMRAFFNTKATVGELNAILRTDKSLVGANGEILKIKGAAEQNVSGWMVFGPKIGSFINNLHGDYSTLTADLWFSRTWNRLLGYSFGYLPNTESAQYVTLYRELLNEVRTGVGRDVTQMSEDEIREVAGDPRKMIALAEEIHQRREKEFTKLRNDAVTDVRQAAKNLVENRGGLQEIPRNDSERAFQQGTVEQVQRAVRRKTGINLTIADIQAVLWYHEKNMYRDIFGVGDSKAAAADYADAAKRFAQTYKEGDLFYVEKPTPRYIRGNKGDYLAQPKLSPAVRSGQDDVRQRREDAAGAVRGNPPRYGNARTNSVQVRGVHYSSAQRQDLSGFYHGTGAKGEERTRLGDPRNADLRGRIYFYVDEGQGLFPEHGVGEHAHDADLQNLYDLKADPIGYRKLATSNGVLDSSKMERLIMQGGFDGWYAPQGMGRQGVAVLVGKHAFQPRYIGTGYRGGEAVAVQPQTKAAETDADRVEKARVLPMGEMKGSDWKRMIPAVIPGADVSMLEDGKTYYKSDVVGAMRGAAPRLSPAVISPAAQAEIAAIEARNAKSPSALVAKNLDNIKRGLAGEVVRDEQGNLLAPNGKKSKLTEKQYLEVRTPAFRKWFGDWLAFHNAKNGDGVWYDGQGTVSKAVDENGEPMIIYHGTPRGGYTVMRPEKGDKHRSPMIFATDDRNTARSYSTKGDEIDMSLPEFEGAEARKIGKDWFVVNKGGDGSMAYNVYGEYVDVLDAEGYVSKKEAEYFRDTELEQVFRDNAVVQSGIYSLYLNIRNPMEQDFEGANWNGDAFGLYEVKDGTGDNIYGPNGERLMELEQAQALAKENDGDYYEAVDVGITTNSVAEEAKKYGHDGVIMHNVVDDGGNTMGFNVKPATVFVFFNSNQAKSATQNNGRFSQKNDDLRFTPAVVEDIAAEFEQRAGEALATPRYTKNVLIYSHTPASIQVLGFGDRQLMISPSDLHKIASKPGFETDAKIGALVYDLMRPAAMFWNEKQGSLNMLRREPMMGKPGIIAVRPDVRTANDRSHMMVTAHALDNKEALLKKITSGELKPIYFDDYASAPIRRAISQRKYRVTLEPLAPENLHARANVQLGTATTLLAPDDLINLEAKMTPAVRAPRNVFELPAWSKTDTAQERIQDRYNRLRDVVKSIQEQGGKVTDANNFDMGEDRFHGVAAARIENIQERVQAIARDTKDSGVSIEEAVMYAYAEHAPERNAAMQRINPNVKTGSGMSDQEAADIIAKAKAEGTDQSLARIAESMRSIARDTLKLQLASGLIDQAEYDTYTAKYQKWVPLRGFETLDENGKSFRGTGKGFNIRGKENLRALGRDSKAGQILENIILDAERTAVRATKNTEVNHRFLQFVLDNPDPSLWEIDAVKMKQSLRNGKVSMDSLIDKADNTIGVKVKGQVVYIKLHDQKTFEQLANMWDDIGFNGIPYVSAFNRYLSKSYTSWSPEFALYTNPARDILSATVSITGREGIGMTGRFIKSYRRALVSAYRAEALGQKDALYEEYRAMGGKTGFYNLSNLEEKVSEINTLLKDLEGTNWRNAWRAPIKAAKKLENLVSGHAGALENATRLASYIAMREAGRSKEEASAFAKNLNVNFNRRGTWTAGLGSIFLFFNPAVQGTHNMYVTLTQGKHKKQAWALLGAAALGMAILSLMNAAAGDDDDGVAWWDKIPSSEKERNIILIIPPFMKHLGNAIPDSTGRYIKFPLPYGWNVPLYGATLAADVYRNEQNKADGMPKGKATIDLMASAFKSFSPVNGLPPNIDPFYRHFANKSAFGEGQLYPNSRYTEHKPASEKYSSAMKGSAWQEWASFVNSATGGNQFQEGLVSLPPAVWRNYVKAFIGGPASFAAGSYDAVAEGDVTKAPFVRKMYNEIGTRQDQAKFYSVAEDAIKEYKNYQDAQKADRPTAEAMYKSNQILINVGGMAERTKEVVGKTYKSDVAIKADKSLSDEQKRAKLLANEKLRSDKQEEFLRRWRIEMAKTK